MELEIHDKLLGLLYGQAIGDSMGVPSELWSRSVVKKKLGTITDFQDGPAENEVGRWFSRGEFTDDTQTALIILESLRKTDFLVDRKVIVDNILRYANENGWFDKHFFGPSSFAALQAAMKNEDASAVIEKAETNGAAMRISPIGGLFKSSEMEKMVNYVSDITKITHGSGVAIAGACMIAYACSLAIEDYDWDDIVAGALQACELGYENGTDIPTASLIERVKLGIQIANDFEGHDEEFSQRIYDIIGANVLTSESVVCSLVIAYYAKEPKKAALLCANLGGDTDTIGAMATAICGAKSGIQAFESKDIELINERNQFYIPDFADVIEKRRGTIA
ncbi:ADP-ribosylglycohydrolase family protein [Lentilactobacillus buchneri]|uniref:ADP-ribosylglycohydrolase family protein n=1 Tax=Lentilactobacillus buchneri TaxID=1581 RepID=UPI001290D9A4|nr:ADP-ribosylglycohydrolase family protein [Lentilactobacillus buchneri]